MNAFEFLKSINTTKEEFDKEDVEKFYVPFVTNRALSYFLDTILYANEMNLYPELDKDAQFTYYLKSIRPRSRYAQWVKSEPFADVQLIQEAFGYSRKRAAEVLPLFTSEQLNTLRNLLDKGGKSTDTK